MNYIIDREDKPLYLQLYKQLRRDITAGVFPYNSKLPSKRSIAENAGISTITVERAYALLCDEGYACARERSGYFVAFRPADGFVTPAPETTPLIRSQVHLGDNPQFSVSLLSKTMRGVLSNYNDIILEKSPGKGRVELRSTIRRYLARNRGMVVDDEQIVIGSGAEYLYRLIIELLGREKVYAIEMPSYEKLEQIYHAAGVKYELLPLSANGIDSAALAASRADVLHTTPCRSYPSGVTASASKRYEYIHWAGIAQRYIIESDYDSEFSVYSKPTETLFTLSDNDNVFYLNTFSKTISHSLRIGYMVLPKKLVAEFDSRLGFYSCTVPTFEQFVLAELINSGDFERHINRVRRSMRRRRDIAK